MHDVFILDDTRTLRLNGRNRPSWRRSPIYWADQKGLTHIAADRNVLAKEIGDETQRPAERLVRRAAEGGTFASLGAAS